MLYPHTHTHNVVSCVLKASSSPLAQCDRSPRSPFQPGPLHSSPLQTPTMSSPHSSPCSATASPIGRPPSYHNGHHRPPLTPHKSSFQSKKHFLYLSCQNESFYVIVSLIKLMMMFWICSGPAQSSPQPPKYPESISSTIRPVSKHTHTHTHFFLCPYSIYEAISGSRRSCVKFTQVISLESV